MDPLAIASIGLSERFGLAVDVAPASFPSLPSPSVCR
jgi:hypothetical protein